MPDEFEPLPDADDFKKMHRAIQRAVKKAIEKILVRYYCDCDVFLIVRNRQCVRVEIRDTTDLAKL